MSVLVTIAALALLALWTMSVYNRLVRLRRQVTGGWRQMDIELKRRHDLVAPLVESVKAVVEFEGNTLEPVLAARRRAVSAKGPAEAGRKERDLIAALGRLFADAERYPQLMANAGIRSLQEELTDTENKVGAARQSYNAIAVKYNAATEAFPGNLIAGFAGFKSAELFELTSDSEGEAAAVQPPVNGG